MIYSIMRFSIGIALMVREREQQMFRLFLFMLYYAIENILTFVTDRCRIKLSTRGSVLFIRIVA